MNCPVCDNDIQDSFGLIECSQCQTMLVADIDGNLKKFSAEEPSSTVPSIDLDPPLEVPAAEWSFDASNAEGAEATEEVKTQTKIIAGPFQDIQDFANSEDSNLSSGEILYHLFLDEVDTQEIKDEVELVLIDPKLKLDFSEEELEKGKLTLKNLNPVKVSVIVSKLKHLPIKMNWTQNSLIKDASKDVIQGDSK